MDIKCSKAMLFALTIIILIGGVAANYGFEEAQAITKRVRWVPKADAEHHFLDVAGKQNGRLFYLARTNFLGGVIPGRAAFHLEGRIIFGFNGIEFTRDDYELLLYPEGALDWINWETENQTLPENIFHAGMDPRDDQPFYFCRGYYVVANVIGKLGKDLRKCDITSGGREYYLEKYEVLVKNESMSSQIFQVERSLASSYDDGVTVTLNLVNAFLIFVIISLLMVLIAGTSYCIGRRLSATGHYHRPLNYEKC